MPLPKGGENFLDLALKYIKSKCIVHFYDFEHEDEFYKAEEKVKIACEKSRKKCRILKTVKCGQYSPGFYRICSDFEVIWQKLLKSNVLFVFWCTQWRHEHPLKRKLMKCGSNCWACAFTKMAQTYTYFILILLAWGLWGFFGKYALKFISPVSLILYESIGAIIIQMIVIGYLIYSKTQLDTNTTGMSIAIFSGLISTMGVILFYSRRQEYYTVSV